MFSCIYMQFSCYGCGIYLVVVFFLLKIQLKCCNYIHIRINNNFKTANTVQARKITRACYFIFPGSSGIVNKSLIEEMSTLVRHQLQVHVKEHKPYEKMRYSSILLLLHTLSGISTQMVQNLFCKHILTNETMDMYIENLLKKQNEG